MSHLLITANIASGATSEKRGLVSNSENKSDRLYSSFIELVPTSATSEVCSILRASHDVEVIYEANYGDKAFVAT